MNLGVMTLYVTGSPTASDNYDKTDSSILQIFTILNVSANKFKVIGVFFQSMIVIVGMTIAFIGFAGK